MTSTTTQQREGITSSPVLSTTTAAVTDPPCIPRLNRNTRHEWKRSMYAAQGGRCWYCDIAMDYFDLAPAHTTTANNFATIEHVTPVRRRVKNAKGKSIGFHPDTPAYVLSRENLVLACFKCNTHRGTLPLTDFIGKLRERGEVGGIISRIRRLVNDSMPVPSQASDFEWYMLQVLAHPRRPGDSLKRLPAELEGVLLPDPSRPLPQRPQPAPKTLLQRVRQRIRRYLTTLLDFLPVGR